MSSPNVRKRSLAGRFQQPPAALAAAQGSLMTGLIEGTQLAYRLIGEHQQ
jgi:hypothetical protein